MENKVITPTIGRKVWYWKLISNPNVDQPEDATVTYVHGDRCVNLRITNHIGESRGMTSVELRQPGDPKPEGPFCEWMPYQVRQAAKTTEAEARTATAPNSND